MTDEYTQPREWKGMRQENRLLKGGVFGVGCGLVAGIAMGTDLLTLISALSTIALIFIIAHVIVASKRDRRQA